MRSSWLRRLGPVLGSAVLAGSSLIAPTAVPALHAADPGPVAEWTFDEASGTTAHDAVGGSDGTLSAGATWVSGGAAQGSGALAFDGVDGAVAIPDAPALHPSSAFTVAAWISSTQDWSASITQMIAKGDLGCSRGASWAITGQMYGPSGAAALTTWPGTVTTWVNGPAYAWSDGKWHLIVYSVDPANQTSSISVDGHIGTSVWNGPDSVLYDGPTLLSSDLRFGATSSCQYRYAYAGKLDDVRIWSRVLSQGEIQAMLPTYPTTTELKLWLASASTEDAMISSAYADQNLTYRVHVTPWPAAQGDVVWHRSDNGGAEVPFATTPLRVVDMTGYQFYNQPAGTLPPGTYTIRAAWQGAGNWPASSSASFPLTITKRPVTSQLVASPNSTWPGGATTLTARLAIQNAPTTYVIAGGVYFYDVTNGANDQVGWAPLIYSGNPTWNDATLQIPSVTAGTHTYEARWAGTSTIGGATMSTQVLAEPQSSGLSVTFLQNPILNTDIGTARVSFGTWGKSGYVATLPAPTGTVTLTEQGTGTVIGQQNVTATGNYDFPLPKYATGTKTFVATYTGDANFDPATSDPATLTIAADIVDATGVGVQFTTFYPYKDGYRDTVAIKGTRYEEASVSARIYSPTGKLVRTLSVASGTGAYGVAWNGRTAAGTALAAGKYKVVQTLTDTGNTKRTWTAYVTISTKRLHTTTVTYTKKPSQAAKKGSSWIAWSFTVPSATVYKSMKFSVDARVTSGEGYFGPEDFTSCGSTVWAPGCASPTRSLPASRKWVSVSGSPAKNIYAHRVRLYAWVNYTYGGAAFVYAGRVTITYGILK